MQPYLDMKALSLNTGKMVYEILPPVRWSKATTIQWLLTNYFPLNVGGDTLLIYLGDDNADREVFNALKDKELTIFVEARRLRPRRITLSIHLKRSEHSWNTCINKRGRITMEELMKSKEPFRFCTQVSIPELTGLKAANLQQLLDSVKTVPDQLSTIIPTDFLQHINIYRRSLPMTLPTGLRVFLERSCTV